MAESRPEDDKSQSRPTADGDVEANRSKSSKLVSRAGWWTETVTQKHADIFFVLCSLITGLSDGVSYATFGCFISMQTGNTIFVGLGASGLPTSHPFGWLKSLVSICSFFVGSFTFATLMRRVGSRQRRTLTTSFAIQSLFIFVAAAVIQSGAIPHALNQEPTGGKLFLELIPLALLAFQFGGQITASRAMGFNELPTIVLTSVYFDIASDPALTAGVTENVKRNRRIGSVTAILTGAIAAGWLCRSHAEMQSALWIAGFIKFCIATAWLFWPPAEER
ncbi:hypothetical protein VTN77DRAFT_269 [Rasamsonia byssochlamydoides]|uniref:uncharacterized protein n=1 Tax=Rasamsonia byssochlamydoides TaxID=89139 RepID=UPI0037431ED3